MKSKKQIKKAWRSILSCLEVSGCLNTVTKETETIGEFLTEASDTLNQYKKEEEEAGINLIVLIKLLRFGAYIRKDHTKPDHDILEHVYVGDLQFISGKHGSGFWDDRKKHFYYFSEYNVPPRLKTVEAWALNANDL